MGLDGISVNQLRIQRELTSVEQAVNETARNGNDVKGVDGLSDGQKIDPDEERNNKKNLKQDDYNESDDIDEEEIKDDEDLEKLTKYDLSNSKKYSLKLDEKTNNILIVEIETGDVIQVINSKKLSIFVKNLNDSRGIMINRKF